MIAAVVSIVAALIALAALYPNWHAARAAAREARATEEQTKIQRQLRDDAAQPYVWADIRPDDATGTLLNLIVGNSGPTVAKKVKIKVDPPLRAIDQLSDRAKAVQVILSDGLESLAPGRTLMWPLGQGFALLNEKGPLSYQFTVAAKGPFGQIPTQKYIVNIAEWRGLLDRPSGNLHQLTEAVNRLTTTISRQTTTEVVQPPKRGIFDRLRRH